MATDIPEIPEPVTTQHYSTRRRCRGCGAVTETNGGGLVVPGTEFEPNMASYICTLHAMPASIGSIRRIVREVFGIDASKGMIQSCLKAAAKALDPCVEDIKTEIAGCDHVHMGETGMPWQRQKRLPVGGLFPNSPEFLKTVEMPHGSGVQKDRNSENMQIESGRWN